MKKTFSILLIIFGVLFTWLTFIAILGKVYSPIERTHHGAGLLFADVETFIALAIFL